MNDDDRLRAIAKASEGKNYAHKHTEFIKKLNNQNIYTEVILIGCQKQSK
jgi:hypothetical protein